MFPVDWQDVKVSCLNEPSDSASCLSVNTVIEVAGALFLIVFCYTLTLVLSETFLTQVYLLSFCRCCCFFICTSALFIEVIKVIHR